MALDLEAQGQSIQSLIDALSIAVDRPVLLDDATLAPLAFSRQWDVDDVRSQSILGRGAQPQVREALFGQGIEKARDLVHIPGDAELGMEGRACVPVRDRGQTYGYIWVLDPDSDLPTADTRKLLDAARDVARLLAARPIHEVPDEAQLIAELRSGDAAVRSAAAERTRDHGFLQEDQISLCLIAGVSAGTDDPLDAARQTVRRLSVGQAIAASSPEGAALIVSLGDPVLRTLPPSELGAWVLAGSRPGLMLGQSSARPLDEMHEASHQAITALRVARTRPGRSARAWAELGADCLVAQLPPRAGGDIPERLRLFIQGGTSLVETLSVFLECSGDVKQAAEELSLHRSGLYYRIQRIEDQTGLDLRRGDDRLLAHLSLRVLGGRSDR